MAGVTGYLRGFFKHWKALMTGFVLSYLPLALEARSLKLTAFGWLLVFVVVTIPAGYLAWRDQRLEVERLTGKTVLTVRFSTLQDPRYQAQHERGYFFVRNEGPGVTENTVVSLCRVEPKPATPDFLGRFPYAVGFPVGEAIAASAIQAGAARRINEGDEEKIPLLDLIQGQFAHLVVGVDGFDTSLSGISGHRRTLITDTERWLLHYKISASNAISRECCLMVMVRDSRVVAVLDNGP